MDDACVGEHGFFFEIADEAVAGAWRDEVGEEEAVEVDALRAEDHQAHEQAWFGDFHECEKMHALVVGFFKQGFDPVKCQYLSHTWILQRVKVSPSIISPHRPQTTEMP